MSVTREAAQADRAPEAQGGDSGLPAASLPESLGVLFTGIVPALVRGLFAPRRWAMKLLTALDTDRRAVRLLSSLHRKHGGEGLKLLGGRIVLLWGERAIREVLDNSAEVYAGDSGAKGKGMSQFQPDAVTLSRGEEWRDRREFNVAVLAGHDRLHPMAERFVGIVQDELDRLQLSGGLDYDGWEKLFDHITLRVIFGDGARNQQRLTALLEKLMAQGQRLVGVGENDDYYDFYGLLEDHLREPEEGSLLARFSDAPHSARTRTIQQIPHWMFAMRDTLASNAFRALAVIAADPGVLQRVRQEIADVDPNDPRALDGMRYLEGCLEEAMRLWPTTPLLARETTHETTLSGERLDEGTQVMMVNVFNHRDPSEVDDPDHFRPDRWSDGAGDSYRFNHLSHGTQDCPGAPLVRLLGKAAIAGALQRADLELEHPQLTPGRPLPYMLDFFQIRFKVTPRRSAS